MRGVFLYGVFVFYNSPSKSLHLYRHPVDLRRFSEAGLNERGPGKDSRKAADIWIPAVRCSQARTAGMMVKMDKNDLEGLSLYVWI